MTLKPTILIGHYDSPFVRRVAIALTLYGLPFEHRAWSVFGDADAIAAYNPLRRVPTLVLGDGEVLIESAAILDAIDLMVDEHRRLAPTHGVQRRRVLKLAALASGVADKAVSLVYERVLHERATPMWIARCRGQIGDVLDALEAQRAAAAGPWFFGEVLTHGDIMVGCALRFLSESNGDVFNLADWPALAAHAARCEALPVFQDTAKPFFVALPAREPTEAA